MLALSLPNGFATHSSPYPFQRRPKTRLRSLTRAHRISALVPRGSRQSICRATLRAPQRSSCTLLLFEKYQLPCVHALAHFFTKNTGGGGKGLVIHRKPHTMNTYEKRSSVQDGRSESCSVDEGSLLGTLLRNLAVAGHKFHKCFVLRTYEKTVCNHCIMNTYETKDLKLPRMNTYRKTGWVEPKSPAQQATVSGAAVAKGSFGGKKVGVEPKSPARSARATKNGEPAR